MKKRIRLTEGQLYRLINEAINEETDEETKELAESLIGKAVYASGFLEIQKITDVRFIEGYGPLLICVYSDKYDGVLMALNADDLHKFVKGDPIDGFLLIDEPYPTVTREDARWINNKISEVGRRFGWHLDTKLKYLLWKYFSALTADKIGGIRETELIKFLRANGGLNTITFAAR